MLSLDVDEEEAQHNSLQLGKQLIVIVSLKLKDYNLNENIHRFSFVLNNTFIDIF